MARIKVYENPQNGFRENVKEGFNWVVLFFGPFWYFFSGLFLLGLAWLAAAIVAGSFTFGIGAVVVWIISAAKANKAKERDLLHKGWRFIGYKDELEQTAPAAVQTAQEKETSV